MEHIHEFQKAQRARILGCYGNANDILKSEDSAPPAEEKKEEGKEEGTTEEKTDAGKAEGTESAEEGK